MRSTHAPIPLLLGTRALASSDDEWEKFRRMVADACRAQVAQAGAVEIEVNPFGSASYGVALVPVATAGEDTDRMACVVDKASGAAELTAPL